MKGRETDLRILQRHLSGRGRKVFPNQVVFYNGVLGLTDPALLPGPMVEALGRLGSGQRPDEPLCRQMDYLLHHCLDSNSANIGKHINDLPDNPVPKAHRAHYLNDRNRGEILRRLRAVIQYCLVCRSSRDAMEEGDFAALLGQLKGELGGVSDTLRQTDLLTPGILANVIYEVLCSFFTRVRTDLARVRGAERRVEQQNAEYFAQVDRFGNRNIDRFFALQRLAGTNAVAANELACVYYYGAEYLCVDEGEGNDGWFRVERDYELAAKYFKLAAAWDPPVTSACWSLGHMALNRKITGLDGEEADRLAETYFQYAADQDFTAAHNSLGLLEQKRGDRLLERLPRLTGEERAAMLAHYRRALELWDRAGQDGWPYGHINVAEFLARADYRRHVLPLLGPELRLEGPMDPAGRWQLAADQGNLWAMNCLALLKCDGGDLEGARALWERAAAWNYPTARLNLALRLYAPDGLTPDPEAYRANLETASAQGSAQASYRLALLALDRSLLDASAWLARAEEQNYEKFSIELYHRICDLRRRIEG